MADESHALRAAEQALADAQALQQSGRAADAVAQVEQAVALAPGQVVILYVAGVLMHGLGRLDRADALLRDGRHLAPGSPELAFALGNLRLDQADPAAAEPLFRDALARHPGFAEARRGLATALVRSGRLAEAESEVQAVEAAGPLSAEAALDLAALRLQFGTDARIDRLLRGVIAEAPALGRASLLLADLWRRRGDLGRAGAAYARALAGDGRAAAAWQGLALVRAAEGRRGPAVRAFRRALALFAAEPSCWYGLGEIARQDEDWSGAASLYRRALVGDPGRTDALIHLGNALDEAGDRAAAASVLRLALAQAPADAMALSNLATVLLQDGDVAAASRLYRQAVALDPANPVAQYNLGNAFRQVLDLDAALTRYHRATSLDPDYATAHLNAAVGDLLAGAWRRGFAHYEWRWRDRKVPLPAYAPWWQGEPLAGRRIVLLGEQGFGDMIHFARYAAAVRDAGGRVVLECYPPLRRLFETLGEGIELIDMGAPPGLVDLQVSLMQLPLIFGTTPETPFAPPRYLSPPPGGPALPPSGAGLRVGFVWAGNPRIEKFHKRSALLEELAPLVEKPGLAAYSLQIGPRAADIARLGLVDRIFDLAPLVGDFADTAALIDQLDLVIAVDTAVAHLAGALGKPVWMLPTYVPDWRWLLGRDDTPWYPSMRLYRQGPDRAWGPVIARVGRDLDALVAL
jgi:tetratricopeptide (TPR) repeat protein